ncbi:hypothetical protein U27_01767 [Candidatus Vecturithrix granuli]|uniref:Sulfotransferase domain-containing protein n=1 Tax=Vecturithrix granuli TaxID=1499967 RepID=A0A0S6W5Q3_VECG1|nr:hypothetical protein U27_01767 [Candidatus Vecturithrix granuli]
MQQPVFLVSGLPRSGTSMMMKMLEAGGIEIVTDHLRQADDDNPKGYYELEKVKHLQNDARWMHYMRGKALKVVSSLLFYVPLSLPYKVIFMRRAIGEILASQKKMLDSRGEDSNTVSDDVLRQKYETHLEKIQDWIAARRNVECLYIEYAEILKDPLAGARAVQEFLGQPLQIEAMAAVVDPDLYRNRVG